MAFAVTEMVTDNFESLTDVNSDGTLWECVFDVKSPQTDFLVLGMTYTKDASSKFNMISSFEFTEQLENDILIDEFFQEIILDDSSGLIFNPEFTEEGNLRVIVPVSKTANRVKISIVADVATGSDTLVLFASEESVKGNR